MKIEHIAFQIEDPVAMGRWYVEHLGFTVKRRLVETPYTHFLADDSGTVMIEIYKQDVTLPDYRNTDPLVLHLALVSANIEADRERLIAAGATAVGTTQQAPNGDQLAMLRDPWGFCVQLAQRAETML